MIISMICATIGYKINKDMNIYIIAFVCGIMETMIWLSLINTI